MADKVYPASKPTPPPRPPPGTAARPAAPPSFPPTKSQLHRPAYRPQSPPKHRPRRRRRSCCCACFLWTTLLLLAILFLAAIAAAAFYVLYHPHQPAFTVSSLRLTTLNISSAGALTSSLDLSVTARNPNQKIAFLYAPSDITVTSGDVTVATGIFPSYTHGAKNTTILKTTLSTKGEILDDSAATDLRKRSTIPLRIDVETRAGAKVAGLKTSKIGIRVRCEGISVKAPKGKGKVAAAAPDASCKVKLKVKIWRWSIYFA